MVPGQLAQLGVVEREIARTRVVQEADLTREPLLAECAQHRHHWRDAAAAADQQHPLGARVRQSEVPLRLGQADNHARPRAIAQVARDPALRVGGDGQLERTVRGLLGAGRRVGPGQADAVELDAHSDELSGAKAAPVLIRMECERHALRRLVADGRHLGPHIAREQRADELDVAVNAMRVGERLEQARVQHTAADATRANLAGSEHPDSHGRR